MADRTPGSWRRLGTRDDGNVFLTKEFRDWAKRNRDQFFFMGRLHEGVTAMHDPRQCDSHVWLWFHLGLEG